MKKLLDEIDAIISNNDLQFIQHSVNEVISDADETIEIQFNIFEGPKLAVERINIKGNTKIGKNNEIFPFVSIGTPPQDLKYKGEKNSIIIGDNNKLREYVNINPGTSQGGTITKLGNNNLLMVYCHVAHDCNLGDNIVLANNVQVGGHVTICLLYTSPSPRDRTRSRMPSSA